MADQETNRGRAQEDAGNLETAREDTSLLTGQRTNKRDSTLSRFWRGRLSSKWREIALFVWAFLASATVIVLAVLYQHNRDVSRMPAKGNNGEHSITGKRNLIFMVSDGMGPSSLSLTRSWLQQSSSPFPSQNLTLDTVLHGQSRTRSASSLITDSAAGATAFSCGAKTYNGAISVLPDFSPCGSVMEAAKRAGYTTGLVVTTSVTDATPAVFAAHARRREWQDGIAMQMVGVTHPLGRVVDLLMGGGRCYFSPCGAEEGCRGDEEDVLALAREKEGWKVIESTEELENLDSEEKLLPLLGLFAPTDLPYEIDRRSAENASTPSLETLTRTALSLLNAATADSEKGFFLMIEGSRIDHAGHANDPAAQVHEVHAYDLAVRAVLDFITTSSSSTPTLLLSTSDHETGGLAIGRQLDRGKYPHYRWNPSVLSNATHSASYTARAYRSFVNGHRRTQRDETAGFLRDLVASHLGITNPTAEELEELVDKPSEAAVLFAEMISVRAEIGWSTEGHTAADVNVYTSDRAYARDVQGSRENVEIGGFLQKWLGVEGEMEGVTGDLRRAVEAGWMEV